MCYLTFFNIFLISVFFMVTKQILLLAENIVNRGNVLGLDRRTLQVYIGEALINDDEPDILVNLDPYILFGGFIETFIECLAKGELESDEKSVASTYLRFAEDSKKFESAILSNTKRYIDEINTLGYALRKLGYKVRFLVSERTSGVELYFLGRTEFLRDHVDRKINEWLGEGVNRILFTSPFEYALYKYRFFSQSEAQMPQLEFYPEFVGAQEFSLKFSESLKAIFLEPYEAPLAICPRDLYGRVLALIGEIEETLRSIENISIKSLRVSDPPFSYEQIWLVSPLTAVSIASNILRSIDGFDAIISLRTSTALLLRVVSRLHGINIKIYDYVEVLSNAIKGA